MELKKIRGKKGQLDDFPIITWVMIVIGLLFIGAIVLKVVRSVLTPFASAVGNMSTQAQESVVHIQTTFVTFWDFVIVVAFLIALILLFISAFLIDVNPVFVVLYIILAMLTMVFAPEILQSVDKIYDSNTFVEETALLPFLDFIRLNFGLILIVTILLTGIIIYSKIKYFPSLR